MGAQVDEDTVAVVQAEDLSGSPAPEDPVGDVVGDDSAHDVPGGSTP
jgi:hypothetical protein